MAGAATAAQATSAPSGNPNFSGQTTDGSYATGGGQAAAGVPQVTASPTVVSSEQNNASFANNSSKLSDVTNKLMPPPAPNPAQSGQDTGNGTATNGTNQGTDTSKGTAVENNADTQTNGTGDPLYDSWNASLEASKADIQQKAQDTTDQFNQMYKSTLMQNDEVYQSSVASAQSIFGQAIQIQQQINEQSLARTRAYGLSSGSALTMPLEFSNAITNNMQQGDAKIQDLNTKLSSAIAAAGVARDKADNDALQSHLTEIDKIQSDMRSAMSQVVTEAQDQLTNLRAIQTQQQAQHQKDQQAYIASAIAQNGDKYTTTTTNADKDSMIKQIINTPGSGLTMADFSTVFDAFEKNAATQTDLQQKAQTSSENALKSQEGVQKSKEDALTTAATLAKDKQDIAQSKASINASNASAALNWKKVANGDATPKTATETTIANVADMMEQAATKASAQGDPYIDKNGYITPKNFDALVTGAAKLGMPRDQFLATYGSKLYPGDADGKMLSGTNATYAGYRMSNAEINKLRDAVKGT